MSQTAIPCWFMRGGTSRGPFFRRDDLPEDQDLLAEVLLAAVGSGHPLCIDGVGGSETVTTKVVMLSKADHDWAAIDYFFAQLAVTDRVVDFSPSCGNMLAGVGPAAVEMGLAPVTGDTTTVQVRNTNTNSLIESVFQTPNGAVRYDGDAAIDGVPGTAAPVTLNFMDVIGSKTGALFPTGQPKETIDGIEVTCIDVAMPMVIARAADFGFTGYEGKPELDKNADFFARMEPLRREAGKRMGLGDVSDKVVPKFAMLAPPRDGGTVTSRYFVPQTLHPTHAVTGAICVASCVIAPGTVAEGIAKAVGDSPASIRIEHPMGHIDAAMDFEIGTNGDLALNKAGLLRTTRLLMRGEVMVPTSVWKGKN